MIAHSKEEIEVKFYPVNIEEIRAKLKSVGATCTHPMRPMKRVVFSRENNPSLPVSFIRVRDEGNCVRVSTKEYADEKKGIKFQRELDVIVDEFDKAVSLLEVAGLRKTHFQESKREQWELEGSEVCIDVWPHLKSYIEIESPSETHLRSVASKLGMVWDDHVNGGALLLYMREYGWEKEEANKYIKKLLFDEPLQRIE